VDFFRNPPVEEEDDSADDSGEPEDDDVAEPEFTREVTSTPKPKRLSPNLDAESIWSDSTKTRSAIEPRGVTDMPNISSTSPMYGKPVFAQRTLREVKPEELWEIVEKMRENTVVMLNLEACTEVDVDKIITFLSGAACFQQGVVRPNGSRSYVLTPPNAEVDSDQEPARSSFLP
jgi:FtsZ-interacting cell division protein YlmF